jgi:hypothetical protein
MSDQVATLETTRAKGFYQQVATLRKDAWWVEPALTVMMLTTFIVYTTWAALVNAHYFADPYLSPFYSPCLSTNCAHPTIALFNWPLSPAILILWAPAGFRLTCYYYRKAYYRSFWLSPPACAVRDSQQLVRGYSGETRFPLLFQNLHRYFFYAATFLIVPFLWWDVLLAFRFPTGDGHQTFGLGLGTLIMLANAALLTLYSLSCHSCRHLCGGRLDVLSRAPTRLSIWRVVSRLNEHHMEFAWVSLVSVMLTDLYIRFLSMEYISPSLDRIF